MSFFLKFFRVFFSQPLSHLLFFFSLPVKNKIQNSLRPARTEASRSAVAVRGGRRRRGCDRGGGRCGDVNRRRKWSRRRRRAAAAASVGITAAAAISTVEEAARPAAAAADSPPEQRQHNIFLSPGDGRRRSDDSCGDDGDDGDNGDNGDGNVESPLFVFEFVFFF